jgi:hypothetical protein
LLYIYIYIYTCSSGIGGGNLWERDYTGETQVLVDVDGMIIVRWIFRKWDVGVWNGLGWLRIEVAGTCEYGNEPSGSIKCGKFLD